MENGKKDTKEKKKHTFRTAVILVILILLLGAGYIFTAKNIEISGNSSYTYDEMKEILFSDNISKNMIYIYFNNIFGEKKDIPFVETYDMEITWPDSVKITVYEKPITGYIEYMGVNMYFDKDGIIVESSSKIIEGIPLVSGLEFDSMTIYSKLNVENDSVFNTILSITQFLEKYQVVVDRIQFDKSYNVMLYKDDVTIRLGDGSQLGEKIYRLSLIMPNFEGLKGTLYLDEFDENNGDILFKKDSE